MKFITQFDDDVFKIDSEKVSKENLFEFGTYRDTKTQVEEFLISGKKLQACRESQFDDIKDDDDFIIDPTRQKNFDLADASNILSNVEKSINIDSLRHIEEVSDVNLKTSERKTKAEDSKNTDSTVEE